MKPGQCGAVQCRRHAATAEQRRQSSGVHVLAARVGYGLPALAQKDEGGHAMLTEARIRAERPCRGAGVDVLRRRTGGTRGQRRCRGPPGFLTLWFGSGKACEGATGVREVRGSSTARD
jgi:hypothetical protein